MPLTLDVRTPDGGTAGTVELDQAIFGIEPNMAALHQAVTAQRAARRSGSHSTLTRAEVRGGGAKPWRQKGTGRARHGSIRSPQWAGGGVAHGPKPRDYRQKVNRKTVRLALRSALSDRAASERIMVIDEWRFAQPRTKDAIAVLENLSLSGQVLLVLDESSADQAADRSFRNLPDIRSIRPSELNAYDILRSDWLVFTRETLPGSDASAGDASPDADSSVAPAPPAAEETVTPNTVDHAAEAVETAGEAAASSAADAAGTGSTPPTVDADSPALDAEQTL